jgi:hypothetical protein
MYERGVPGGAINPNSTGYPDHGGYGDLPLQGEIPTAEPGIEHNFMHSSQNLTTKPRGWSFFNAVKCSEIS